MSEHHSADHVHTSEVVLDIGEDMGGLIFHTPVVLRGEEIEVCPLTDPEQKTHTDVHERLLQGHVIFTAVFVPLPVGDYQVCRPVERAGQQFTLRPGQVTEIDWR